LERIIPIIGVTGTKGKTTVVNLLADVLKNSGYDTLHVDTSGHYINGVQQSNIEDSKRIWGYKTPTISPGRYLADFVTNSLLKKHPAAILECSFSCHNVGLGYQRHDVGVFLNVFEDHVDPNGKIKNKEDLAIAKSFIFSSIADQGWAVFNADDPLVCRMLSRVRQGRNIKLIACGTDFKYFDAQSHLLNGGVLVTVKNNSIVLKTPERQTVLCDLRKIGWTFGGEFKPSVMNLMHVCAALYGFYNGELPKAITQTIQSTKLDPNSGRLVRLRAENGVEILADYAHEKVSLVAVAQLARTLACTGGRVIGVLRLNHERSDDLIKETGRLIAKEFDDLIIYDKIDGYLRMPVESKIKRYPQIIGRTSDIFSKAIEEQTNAVKRIIREDQAIEFAAKIARPGDAVLVILNDDIRRSLSFIKKSFKANII
jgi:UDP-N-acetylmuramyl tripeptide synthase